MGKRKEGIPPPFERRGGFPLRFGCLLSVKLKLRRRGEAMAERPWPMHRVPCPPPALCDPPCHTPKSSGVSGRTYHLLAGASPSEEASRSWVKERGIPLPGRERGIPIPRWERGEGRVRKAGKASLPCPHPEGCLSRETRSIPVGILSKSTHPERRSWRGWFFSSGFRVQGSRFRVQGSGFMFQGSGFKVQGSRFKVQGSWFRVHGSWFGVQDS